MAVSKRLITAAGYGLAFGALFLMLGSVAHSVVSSVDANTMAVLGILAGAAVELGKHQSKDSKQ